jgi:hypothetical protein
MSLTTAQSAVAFLANVGLDSRIVRVGSFHVVQSPTTLVIPADLAARLRSLFEQTLALGGAR